MALGLVNGVWRNTSIENWHAEGRMHDGDMLRINSHTSWRVRQRLRKWVAENGLTAGGPVSALDGIMTEDVEWLAALLFRWFVNPRRKLPTGVVLGELAGDDLSDYEDDAAAALGGFVQQAEDRGTRFALMRAAAHGAGACRHWWGHPQWPDLVGRFLSVLDDPGNEHWGPGGEWRNRLLPEPVGVADRKSFRRILLGRPWELSPESAQWVTNAGIGYLRSKVRHRL
jgi:hypothetical protein